MDDGSRLPFIIAALLLCCAVYCAVTEISVSASSKIRLRAMADKGNAGADKALYVLDHFDQAISTLLIATNIVHISTASIVTVAVTKRWGLSAVSVSTIITTLVIFFAGEMLPKSVAKKFAEPLACAVSPMLVVLMKLFAPLSKLLAIIGETFAKLTPGDSPISVTEDELYDIIEDMTEDGSLNQEQGELISSALQFGDVTVESVLTPRVDVVALNVRAGREEILETVRGSSHSRLPVYEGSVDNVIGILQIRRFIKAYLHSEGELDIRPLLEDVHFVHQSTSIAELLPRMSRQRINIAVVTDNYGGTLGIVTVEDILEELVGEIWDEDDVVRESIVRESDGSYLVDADESVSDVMEELCFDDPEQDEELVNTLMGAWAYEQFPTIPRVGDGFDYHGLRVSIHSMEHNRIVRLRVALPGDVQGEEAEA